MSNLSPTMLWALWGFGAFLVVGIQFGIWCEARRWRSKGDHDYMNRCESGGVLYIVKRESRDEGGEI